MNLLTSSGNLFLDQSVQVSQGLSSNQAKQEIGDLIRSSAGVVSQYPISGAAQYSTGSQILVLRMPSVSQNGQIIESVYDYAVVSPESKILRLQVFPDGSSLRKSENKVLSTSLKDLSFSYLDANNNPVSPTQAARITFTIDLLDKGGISENESNSSSTVNLKNL